MSDDCKECEQFVRIAAVEILEEVWKLGFGDRPGLVDAFVTGVKIGYHEQGHPLHPLRGKEGN